MLKNAQYLARGRPARWAQGDMPYFRRRMLADLTGDAVEE